MKLDYHYLNIVTRGGLTGDSGKGALGDAGNC